MIEFMERYENAIQAGGIVLIVIGVFMFVAFLASDPYRYRASRRRPLDPQPWHREPTTGYPILRRPSADANPPHNPRHRYDDTQRRTNKMPYNYRNRARAMLPPPPEPLPGEDRRALDPQWREQFRNVERDMHPSEEEE